jgi:ubiquinone/menaquinone biosynthesis C-methylase UbiE
MSLFARLKLQRDISSRIAQLLDRWLPPALRDSRLVMRPLFRLALGRHADLVLDFKERALSMSDEEMRRVYASVTELSTARPTDLSSASADAILDRVVGDTVLEVGCGRGALAARLAATRPTTAVDFVLDHVSKRANLRLVEANVERGLPFAPRSFATVVCTHTLEHLRDAHAALAELRRVAARRLVLVVPSQRPYRYTFDLHIQFFPYLQSLLVLTGTENVSECRKIDGDILYVEDRPS